MSSGLCLLGNVDDKKFERFPLTKASNNPNRVVYIGNSSQLLAKRQRKIETSKKYPRYFDPSRNNFSSCLCIL